MEWFTIALSFVLIAILVHYPFSQPKSIERFDKNYFETDDSFDVYLINLKRKPERLRNFIKAYNATDLRAKKFIRVEAVDGQQIPLESYMTPGAFDEMNNTLKRGYRTRHNQLTPGGVGCYLSHMKIFKNLVASEKNFALVFEDDIMFNIDHIFESVNSLLMQVPDDWDMILLGCICNKCKSYSKYRDAKHFFLLHAYILRKTGAQKILNLIEFKPIQQQIDSELSALAQRGDVRIYCLSRSLVSQDNRVNQTTIQTPLKMIAGIDPFRVD
jgi:GR25 family glycosyltransferase involved in LPS biosynthesis